MRFTTSELRADNFEGWTPLLDIRSSAACPASPGVYVVTYPKAPPVAFLPESRGGWFKGRNPSVPSNALAANWVDRADVVYIGKANDLRRRLRQFADFGSGKAIGHWGGRLLWHLDRPGDLVVAWKETPHDDPLLIESVLISAFRGVYGKPPFANNPDRLGN